MADYPSDLLNFAIPPAGKNRAGLKQPIDQEPAVMAKLIKKKPPAVQAPKKPTPLESLKLQGKAAGIQFGKGPMWMGADAPTTDEVTPVDPPNNEFDPFTVDPQLVPDAVVESRIQPRAGQVPVIPMGQTVVSMEPPSETDKYLHRKSRLTMDTQDGQYSMPVTDVRRSKYSVLVLIPLRDDSSVFIPKLGSKLTLTVKETSTKVVYPGAYVEIDELKTGFMTLIVDES